MTSENARLLRLATYASVVTASVLILAKLVAWLITGSVTVLASLVDSLMDAGASVVNLIAVRYALLPPDDDHRFGHGKAEALAGLAQAAFIAGSSLFLILNAVDRLRHPQALTDIGAGVTVMLFSIVATGVLLAIQHKVIARTQSTAVRADALHYATDLATNAATLVALVLALYGWSGADPWFALAIAAYILYSALEIGRDAVDLLMDRELAPEERAQIIALATAVPQVGNIHALRTRRSGPTKLIQLHVGLPDDLTLVEAHAISDQVEASLHAAFPDADIIIHQDPLSLGDEGDRSTVVPGMARAATWAERSDAHAP